MNISPDTRIGKLAATYPGASRVFMRRGLDFCCSGKKTLADVCDAASLDAALIVQEIEAESVMPDQGDAVGWQDRPLDALIAHILEAYHAPLRTELPRLVEMAAKVHRVHGERDPERLQSLLATLTALGHELESHMLKEERVLFPRILAGHGATSTGPISMMLLEHDDAGASLERIRALTDTFVPPTGACATWRALWTGLEQLDAALRIHIHLENNVLFPRALNGELAA